ncbi:type I polyketide synthase [Streptacidiphilus jiangxiensis]|uniref:Acyl transferase domain-containing protein n=1 Tax=Streptacidiphilus jiangxiensis TaxID=235985 RepID=A0A1H7P3S8_STRJI|nr:type I polyketide synthase [Streptacidiphilus jiangxiensis]SEL30530.1 Acyl transferase domain-containing protein [Streptacidiphilus jiangxiensis]
MTDTLLDRLARYADERGDALAYRYLPNGDVGAAAVTVTYLELRRRVEEVAALVARHAAPGERALLYYPGGLDFVVAFLGCLRAGVIAVPTAGPDGDRSERAMSRTAGSAADCAASIVLTTQQVARSTRLASVPGLSGLRWLPTDRATGQATGPVTGEAAGPAAPFFTPSADDVAFIQYTSGSTGSPRGVMVTHANLMHNLAGQEQVWHQGSGAHMVSWLPAFHDMGLIGGLLHPLFIGAGATILPPEAFVQRPLRWLEAISAFGGTLSCAPDFAYELCSRTATEQDLARLDLSRWSVAANGAEPVRIATLDRFAERFASAGFRREAFTPGYGLAESTLVVSGVPFGQEPRATEHGVSCGRPIPGVRVAVVSPTTGREVGEGETGEIWVHSASNAAGYWDRPQETRETFQARLEGAETLFLRTGDLGALRDGELYVTGRIKDLIIVAGRNHYPQDVEASAERAAPAVRAGCVAAFATPDDERLVIVAEVRDDASEGEGPDPAATNPSSADLSDAVAAIRAAVSADHGLEAAAVVLIAPRTLPKTTSGKIRRGACRALFLDDSLTVRHQWNAASTAPRTVAQLESWLLAHVALRTGTDVRQVAVDAPFDALGLASVDVVALSGELADWLGRPVSPTALYDRPTIAALARHLAEPARRDEEAAGPGGAQRSDADEAVAIVGIGCRFPGAEGPDGFWNLLRTGSEAIVDIPADRWDVPAHLAEGAGPVPGRMYTGQGGFLADVAGFDPVFFGMSAVEARMLDPQQRLMLELAWEAFEDAGVLPSSLAGTDTGVFVGITTSDYVQEMRAAGVESGPYAGTGNLFTMAANRVSYTFDLRGPSLAVDTACSSSLVAVHQACVSLRRGECRLALAGGVNLMLSPESTIGLCQAGALSPDGHSYTFDARANGYARGEGGGLVLLKPLSRALADGDRVYGVIRGSAVNQDGRSNGLRAPSTEGQVRVIQAAHRDAGSRPGTVRYVEAHGTGTALGDPIEAGAVGRVVGADLPPDQVCLIGSAKTNIGHLEAAAGVAGLAKVALSLHHRALPPSLHFETPNPHIDFAALRLTVPTGHQPWPSVDGRPALAGVSSFGIGGTNAHLVLEAAPAAPPDPAAPAAPAAPPRTRAAATGSEGVQTQESEQLFVLSARTPAALDRLAERVADFLRRTDTPLDRLCATAALRRTAHEHRLAVAARSKGELADRLRHATRGSAGAGPRPKLVLVFPGQGAQYAGMARSLYETEPAFTSAVDAVDPLVQARLGWSPRAELLADEPDSRLAADEVAQVMLFTVQVGLTRMWAQRGVAPDAVVGHSMGEVAAALAAGALTLSDAVRITCSRAALLATVGGRGATAVVGLPADRTTTELERFEGRLHLAAVNGPALCVVSGDPLAVKEFAADLEAREVFCRLAKVDTAAHSPLVDPLAELLTQDLGGLAPRPTAVPLYSTVTGEATDGRRLDAGYWGRNLRRPVLFQQAVERLLADGHAVFLELSPHPTLVAPIQDTLAAAEVPGCALATLIRTRQDRDSVLEALGGLWTVGHRVGLGDLHDATLPVVSLPSGPWEHEPCWFDRRGAAVAQAAEPNVAETVAGAFADVLRVARVGPDDSFFELGGTSLMAAQMLHDLRTALTMEIPLRLLFEHPTPTRLTAVLAERRQAGRATTAGPELVRTEADDYPLTINQERMLLAERGDDAQRAAHVLGQHLVLDGPVDPDALAVAVHRTVSLHDGLRTGFTADGTRQFIREVPSRSPLTFATLPADGELRAAVRAVERPFRPHEPLFRFHLLRDGGRHILCTAISHLVADGWSQGVLLVDLVRAYEAALDGRPDGLEPPPLRLVDYAVQERATLTGPVLQAQQRDWEARLAAARPARPGFVRTVDPAGRTAVRSGFAEALVGPELTAALEVTARATATTPQMLVLAAYLLALGRHGGQPCVTVPATWSGRDRPDLARVVGFISQPQLITCDFTGAPTLGACLRRVRDAVLDAGEEQRLSMSQYFHLAGQGQEEIPIRISMNYLPPLDVPERMGQAAVSLLPRQSEFSLFRDILLLASAANGATRLSFLYAADLIDPDAMRDFASEVLGLLDAFATDLDQPAPPSTGLGTQGAP